MAIPTTQKECTTRRIASLIIGLWDKIKKAFLLKTSLGAANGVASLDVNGKVPSSQIPQGIYSDFAEFFTWKPDRRDNSPLCATSGICRSGCGMDPVTYSAGTWLCINVSNGFTNGVVTLYMATYSDSNPVTYVVEVSAFRYGRHTIYVKGNQRSGYSVHINKFYLKSDQGGQAVVYFKLESACSFSFRTDGNITSQNVTVSDSAPYSDGIAVSSNDIASNVRMAFGESGYVYGTGGSQSVPVYVDSNGKIQECTGPFSASQLPSNGSSSDGIVESGSGQDTKSWMTDDNGNPAWRDIQGIKFKEIGLSSTNKDNLNNLSSINQICAYTWSYNNNGNVLNKPANDACTVLSFGFPTGGYAIQVAMDGNDNGNALLIRYKTKSTWGSWFRMRDASWILTGTISRSRLPSDIPVIEHVTTIPVNPTVGTIYAL